MIILSIETSCDETAVSVVRASGGLERPTFEVLGNALYSQIDLHREYGGVFPTLAKREHAKNLPFLLKKALSDAKLLEEGSPLPPAHPEESPLPWEKVRETVAREEGLYEGLREVFASHPTPPAIDMITVTSGPGLEPALWVGISCALALGTLWHIPVIPSNHMEGHITSVLVENNQNSRPVNFPALALLISGGHTELVSISGWGQYEILGQTRDDAVGEAFDKVARLLGLPYPGGPEISRLADRADADNIPREVTLPRPMIHSHDFNFSFSGLKTAVLYYIRDHSPLTDALKADIAREFQDAVIDVLRTKTEKALIESGAQTLIVGGGVISNTKIRENFTALSHSYPHLAILFPARSLATDNALMIASAAYIQISLHPDLLTSPQQHIVANGNLSLSTSLHGKTAI